MSWFLHFVAGPRRVGRSLIVILATTLALPSGILISAQSASADCLPAAGPNVTCSGTTNNPGGAGFGDGTQNNFSINVLSGASVIGGANDGLNIGGDNFVTNYGAIIGQAGYGINATGNLNVFNAGTIKGLGSDGIIAGDLFLTNASSGTIFGKDRGIFVDNVTLTNWGVITGGDTGVRAVTSFANVVNYGTISGSMQTGYGIRAPRVNVTNFGTISGDNAILPTGPGTGSVLDNSGTIIGRTAAVDFSSSSNDTLTFRPGSRIVGALQLGTNDTVNIHTGRDIAWTLDFGGCGCGGIGATGSTVKFFGNAPYVIAGDKIATLDATAFGLADKNLMDFSGWVSSLLGDRFGELGGASGSSAATGFVPESPRVADAAHAAFASAMPVSSYAPASKGPGALPNATYVDRASGTAIWSKAFAGVRQQDGDDVLLASTSSIYGGAIGVDGQLRPDLRVGLFFGAGYGKFEVDRSSQKIETDHVFGGVYGRFDWNAHFIDFAVTAGHSSNDNSRLVASNLAPGGLETASSKYDGWFLSPELAYGIRIPVAADMILTPTARVRYLTGHFGGYAESGSAQNLVVAGRDLQDIEERFELALSRFDPVASGVLKTTATLGAVGLQRIGDKTVNSVLLGQNLSFAAPGEDSSYGGYVGLGVDYRASQRVNLFAGVEGTLMNDKSRTGIAKGGARVAF